MRLGASTGVQRAGARRYVSTASTRRWSSPPAGRPSLPRIERTCVSTVRSSQPEPLRDRRVRASLGHERQHLALARGQLAERVVAALRREERRDNLRIERRAAVAHPPRRIEEVVHVEHALLEQVPEAASGRDQLETR